MARRRGVFLPEVAAARAAAATEQLTTLAFNTNCGTATPVALEPAERLTGVAPPGLDHVFFTSGGSEAAEAAWKLVREHFQAIGQPQRTGQGPDLRVRADGRGPRARARDLPIADGGAVIRHGIASGGHPVSAAIGLKNIEIFERDGVLRALPAPRHGAAGAAAV